MSILLSVFWLIIKYFQIKRAILELDESGQTFPLALAFIPALLGISYPLIIQTIQRLNDQYSTTAIAARFDNENLQKWLFRMLVASTVVTITAIVFNDLMFLSFISVLVLITVFFNHLGLQRTYQSARGLFDHYFIDYHIFDDSAKTYKRKKNDKILSKMLEDWQVMLALMHYAIKNGDTKLQDNIRIKFIDQCIMFIKYVDQKGADFVEFPPEVRNGIYEILATYIKHRDETAYQNFDRLVGSIYFSEDSDSKENNFTHTNTFYAIWANLVLMIEHDRHDKVLRYWGAAHQHCTHKFNLYGTYSRKRAEGKESGMAKQTILKHRSEFLEFHFVLGSYVMYKRRFTELQALWYYTQSQPPSYELVPQSMTGIFYYYFHFLGMDFHSDTATIHYWFKDLPFDAMNGRMDVKAVARRYACLLFLRQWILPNYYGQSAVGSPQLPIELDEKRSWQRELKGFRRMVDKLLQDRELMEGLGMRNITEENCKADGKPYPLDFIDKLEVQLAEGYENQLKTIELDPDKTKKVESFTVSVIKESHADFMRISGNEVQEVNIDKVSKDDKFIRGRREAVDKLSLVKNSGVSYIGFDTDIGNRIRQNYYNKVSIKFYGNTRKRYVVQRGRLFDAVDKLSLPANQYVIVAFFTDLQYLKGYKNVVIDDPKGNENFQYKGISVYYFSRAIQFANNTFYILRVTDLPNVMHFDWKERTELSSQQWETLQVIDESLHIYGAFKAIKDDVNLVKEYLENSGRSESDIQDLIEVQFDFLGAVWFKEGVNITSISEGQVFQEGGNLISVDSIEPITKAT